MIKQIMLFKINLENINYHKKIGIMFKLLNENIYDLSIEDDEKHEYIINNLQEIRKLKQLTKENNSRKLILEQQSRGIYEEYNNYNSKDNKSWIYDYDSE